MLAAIVSALHVLALGIGLPAVYLRSRALRSRLDDEGLRRVFTADTVWGAAAVLWLATGLLRAFAGLEKGSDFYVRSPLFWLKMTLFLAVIALEIRPMTVLMGWRAAHRQGRPVDPTPARALHLISHVEMALVIAMVFVAAFMTRGFGLR